MKLSIKISNWKGKKLNSNDHNITENENKNKSIFTENKKMHHCTHPTQRIYIHKNYLTIPQHSPTVLPINKKINQIEIRVRVSDMEQSWRIHMSCNYWRTHICHWGSLGLVSLLISFYVEKKLQGLVVSNNFI